MKEEHDALGYLQDIDQWFKNLDAEQQAYILSVIEQGKDAFLDYLGQEQPGIQSNIIRFIDYLDRELKEGRGSGLLDMLRSKGMTELGLCDKLVEMNMRFLYIYQDATMLREADTETFERYVNTIIRDVFVERNYRSVPRLQKALRLDHPETARDMFVIVRSLIRNFYEQNASYDEVEEFMTAEIGIPPEHVKLFTAAMRTHRDALERYFLFDQLIRMRQEVQAWSLYDEEQ